MSDHSNPNLPELPRVGVDAPPRISYGANGDPNLTDPATAIPPGLSDAPGPSVGYGGGGGGEQTHLMDYVRVLYKRRWTAITVFLLVFGSVTIYTFTATPIYEARLQLLIENQEQKVVQFQQVLDESRTLDYYQTQYRVLQSRALARRTLDAEQLWMHPLFAGSGETSAFRLNPLSWPGGIASTLSRFLSPPKPDEAPDSSETTAQSVAIDRFLGYLTVAPVRNSRLVEIGYRSPEPQLSARIANALARQYIEQNLEFKFLATKEATEFLGARMAEQRKALEQSEQALQKYREQTGAVALEDRQNIVVQRLADLNSAVTRARTDRIEKEAVYNQIRGVQTDRVALDTVPAILSNAFIQQLKVQLGDLQRQQAQLSEKFGERHPEMVKVRSAIESTEARIGAEVQKVVQALRKDYEAALSNENALITSLNQQRGEAQELNRAAIQYGVLARDASMNRQMFEGLLQRTKETDIAGDLKTSNIRVVDPAETPRSPATPSKRNNLLLALFGGCFLGVGLAFFFEYLDNRIKSPEEIRAHLGLAYLGLVPAVPQRDGEEHPLLNNGVQPAFSEAFRSIRTNVLFSFAQEGSRTIVVTSTGPAEGKSTVAANLAVALAQAGQRVLLIDADMRRPKMHDMFKVSQEPGLSNVLVGNSKASDSVRKSEVPSMWLLTAGRTPPNPAELIGSNRCRDFIASLNQHFDWVIIDSPPVMPVTDAALMAHYSSGVVFVVGSEMTSRQAAARAVEHLEQAKANFVGAVLNRVDLQRNGYYYSQYYRREYTRYYATSS